ncbi:ferrous iron transporter B, partial [bacterium]
MSTCHGPAVAVAAPVGTRRVAVVGNPNAGKTTLFNSLTGLHQKVANYAGVTVERVSGTLRGHRDIEVVDVPGLYSLAAVSEDERVAVAEILGTTEGRPDLLVVVIDATNLERNLYLYTQIAERGVPVVVALNMIDRIAAKGATLDLARLSNLLGAEVVPLDGKRGRGVSQLIAAIERGLDSPQLPSLDLASDPAFEGRLATLRERLARSGFDVSRAELVAELATPTHRMLHFASEIPELNEEIEALARDLPKASHAPTVDERYRWSAMVQSAVTSVDTGAKRNSLTDRIDAVLTHRVFGLAIFVALMYFVFQSIYTFAAPLMDLIEAGFGALSDWVGPKLAFSPVLQSLIVDGLIAGVGGVLVFLPQILILFALISI